MSELEKLFEELKTLPRSFQEEDQMLCRVRIGWVVDSHESITSTVSLEIADSGDIWWRLGVDKLVFLGEVKTFEIPALVPEVTRILREAVESGRALKAAYEEADRERKIAELERSRRARESRRRESIQLSVSVGGQVSVNRTLLRDLLDASEKCLRNNRKAMSDDYAEKLTNIINDTSTLLGVEGIS